MPTSAAPAAFGTQVPDASTRVLADEVEAWLKKVTPAAAPAPTPRAVRARGRVRHPRPSGCRPR